jgi:hypothetical protein
MPCGGHATAQQLDALLWQLFLERFLWPCKASSNRVTGGEERHPIETEEWILVLEVDQQNLASLRLLPARRVDPLALNNALA